MADATTWSKVAVNMQSAIATAIDITAITKASPGVVTSAGHGYANGDIVILQNIQGMTEINDRVFRVANVATDTFELEGEDTTAYGTFSSGTAQKVTLGTSITSATDVNASGGDFGFLDITTIHDEIKKQIPDLPNAIVYNMGHIWDMNDSGQIAMKAASQVQDKRVLQFIFRSGKSMLFWGYVGYSGVPGGDAQSVVKSQSVFTLNNTPTYYAS